MDCERTHVVDSYDWNDDHQKNIEFAYAFIRERVARGGKGWKGYPEMNGEPLIEPAPGKHADRFRTMAERIDRNPSEFGGACVIVPPGGGDPIEFLVVDPKGDLAQFFSTIQTKLAMQLEGLKDKQRSLQQWR